MSVRNGLKSGLRVCVCGTNGLQRKLQVYVCGTNGKVILLVMSFTAVNILVKCEMGASMQAM